MEIYFPWRWLEVQVWKFLFSERKVACLVAISLTSAMRVPDHFRMKIHFVDCFFVSLCLDSIIFKRITKWSTVGPAWDGDWLRGQTRLYWVLNIMKCQLLAMCSYGKILVYERTSIMEERQMYVILDMD